MLRRTSIVAAIAIALVLVVNVGAFAVDPSIDVNPIKGISHTDLGLNNLWIVIGAVLVIFMQAGFALVETGFCRAKHAAHVVSTNFAIFGLGFVAFFLIGFSIMFSGFSFAAFGLTKSLSTDSLIHFGNSGNWVFLWGRSGCGLSGVGVQRARSRRSSSTWSPSWTRPRPSRPGRWPSAGSGRRSSAGVSSAARSITPSSVAGPGAAVG